METHAYAIELTGTVDECHQLNLDRPIPIKGPQRVRVIVMYSPEDEIDENEWMHAASVNSAFLSLSDSEEDIYTLTDGKPYHDEV